MDRVSLSLICPENRVVSILVKAYRVNLGEGRIVTLQMIVFESCASGTQAYNPKPYYVWCFHG